MKLAFCLFKYFPYGGLQRDFLRIIHVCQERGHEVHAYTTAWEGNVPSGLKIHILPSRSKRNHVKNHEFATEVKKSFVYTQPDLVIGFNKMPYLDIYYAGDVCYKARSREKHHFLYRLLPRYRHLVAQESAVFAKGLSTEIMLIAPAQQTVFQNHYQTEPERFHLLPPGIAKDRIAPPDAEEIRATVRARYQIAEEDKLLLLVGSGFKTKGLDRAIAALAALPPDLKARCKLFVIGQDNPVAFKRMASKLKIAKQVCFMGGRSDVADFLLAGDLLIHPAYHENAGMILLEAMISGLPVLTVDVCGYSHYIQEANAGTVLASPFDQNALTAGLEAMLTSPHYPAWQKNGLAFASYADIYSLPEKAADLIESLGRKRVYRS